MKKKRKRLISMALAAVLLGSTLAGATQTAAYADQTPSAAQTETVNFKSLVSSQDRMILRPDPQGNLSGSRKIYAVAMFSSESDRDAWYALMDQNMEETYLTTHSKIMSSNENFSNWNGNHMYFNKLTPGGDGIILSQDVYAKKTNEQGFITIQLDSLSAEVPVRSIPYFGGAAGVTGNVQITPNFKVIKQNQPLNIKIEGIGGIQLKEGVTWETSTDRLTIEDLGNGEARITANERFPLPVEDTSLHDLAYVYATTETSSGRKIVSEGEYRIMEPDPSFTLQNESDKAFTLTPGENRRIPVTVLPESATLGAGSVILSSSKPEIATASFDYASREIVVTPGSEEGSTYIDVRATVKGTACEVIYLNVTVTDPNKKIEITDNGTEAENIVLDLDNSEETTVSSMSTPQNADVTDVMWSAEGGTVTVKPNTDGTAVITPVKPGKATLKLTAKVNGDEKTDTCDIYVVTSPKLTLKVNREETKDLFLVPQGRAELSAEVSSGYPEDLKAETEFHWTSNEPDVASASNAQRTNANVTVKAGETGTAEMNLSVTTKIPGVTGTEKTAEAVVNIDVQEAALTAYIDPADPLMKIGRSVIFMAMVKTEANTTAVPRITGAAWKSGDSKVIKIATGKDPYMGIAKAIGEGTTSVEATLDVTFGGLSQVVKASASNATVTRENIPEFKFEKDSITVKAGADGKTAVILATPSDADVRSVEWNIGDKSVAEVDGNGLEAVVTGKKAGTTQLGAVVTAYVNGEEQNISVKDIMQVKVTEDSIKVSLNPSSFKVKAGGEKDIELKIKASPSDASYMVTDIQWNSDNESAATVTGDETGATVTGQSAGKATITADLTVEINGTEKVYTAESVVTVTEDTLTIKLTPESMTLKKGADGTLKLTADPKTAVKSIVWATSDPKIAKVSSKDETPSEAIVTAAGKGNAVITATVTSSINGKEVITTKTSKITVTEDAAEVVNIAMSPASLNVKIGEKGVLEITSDKVGAIEQVKWTSDQEATATVKADSESGLKATVTGVNAGTTKIKAAVTVRVNGKSEIRTVAADVTVIKESNGGNSDGGSGDSGSSGSSGSSWSSGRSVSSNQDLLGTWQKDSRGWWFREMSGSYPANKWGKINQTWYYFGADGYMMTGWQFINGQWYYLTEAEQGQGAMVNGWFYDTGYQRWFYLGTSGAMVTGWQEIGGVWYYFNPISDGTRGAMAADTVIDGYTVNHDGARIS